MERLATKKTLKSIKSIFNTLLLILAIHCVWDDWILGECSKTCGTGTRIDTRVKLVEEANGGTCTGPFTETKACKIQECPGK